MTFQEKIRSNTEALLSSVSKLSDEQCTLKRSGNTWNVVECLEHIYLVDSNVANVLRNPAAGENSNRATELFGEAKLNHLLVAKRTEFKVPAPEFVSPIGRFKTLSEAKAAIQEVISGLITHLNSNDIAKETTTFKHPRLGEMTKTDWLHFLVAHTNRHILQIEELKSLKTPTSQ